MGPRRRARGLRREEVAVLAGVSTTWYTYLEQGRKIRPSPEVLNSLAQVLLLTEDERRYIHLLALGHPPAIQHVEAEPARVDLVRRIVRLIGDGPHPVYAGNQHADIVAWNSAAVTWYTDFGALPPDRRNMLWWMLTAPEAPDRLVDWHDDTRDLIARLRAAYATRPQDRKFNDLLAALQASSPLFQRWWSEHDVHGQRTRIRRMRTPELGTKVFNLVALRLADDGFNYVLLHLPVEDD